jgi:hypothetical protein
LLEAPDCLVGMGANEGTVRLVASLTFLMSVACAGVGLGLYPILRRFSVGLAIGVVGFRLLESMAQVLSGVGVIGLLAVSRRDIGAGSPEPGWFGEHRARRSRCRDRLRLPAHCQGSLHERSNTMNKNRSVSRVLGLAFVAQFVTSFGSGVFLKSTWFRPEDMRATMLGIASNPVLLRANVVVDILTALGVIVLGTITQVFGYSIPVYFYAPYVPFELVIGVWILISGVVISQEGA